MVSIRHGLWKSKATNSLVSRLKCTRRSLSSLSSIEIIDTVAKFHNYRRSIPNTKTIGFVPTMGGLHAGHISLVRQAKAKCDIVATSIFVNPTQFGPNEDFHAYPRTIESDIAKLNEEGVDFVFAPSSPEEIYPPNFCCTIVPSGFDNIREGKCRPGHFSGVATVVTKLFHIVQPTHAFFGEKDAAQGVLIKRLVNDLNFNIDITLVPVAREQDGLAMSTRNQYLNSTERAAAGIVYRGLRLAKEKYDHFVSRGNMYIPSDELVHVVEMEYSKEPLINEIQYVSIASKETMQEIEVIDSTEGAILSVAVKLGSCRLIDTITL